jgi:hypothetical protein
VDLQRGVIDAVIEHKSEKKKKKKKKRNIGPPKKADRTSKEAKKASGEVRLASKEACREGWWRGRWRKGEE